VPSAVANALLAVARGLDQLQSSGVGRIGVDSGLIRGSAWRCAKTVDEGEIRSI